MKLDEFRSLSEEQQLAHLLTFVVVQNPRLRVGEAMNGAASKFRQGRAHVDETLPNFEQVHPTVALTITDAIRVTVDQLAWHPFIELPASAEGANWVHGHSVQVLSDFDGAAVGSVVKMKHKSQWLDVTVTQEMIDSTTVIWLRAGFSK